jgi:RHS repeat-associated protein
LGNVRLSYFNNGSGAEVLEENNYYPFGLKHQGYNVLSGNLSYQYKYNGKELQQESGMYAMDWRNYMPELGRFSEMDVLSESYSDFTPYHFAMNNPVIYSDPTGMYSTDHNGNYSTTNTGEISKLQSYFGNGESVDGLGDFISKEEVFKEDIEEVVVNVTGKGNKDTWNLGNNYLFNSYTIYNSILKGLNNWNFQTNARTTSDGLAGVRSDGPIQYVGGAGDPTGVWEVGGMTLSAISGGKGNYILAALMITRSGNTTGLKMLAAERGILEAETTIAKTQFAAENNIISSSDFLRI